MGPKGHPTLQRRLGRTLDDGRAKGTLEGRGPRTTHRQEERDGKSAGRGTLD